jgi:hypothetical protein
MWEVSEFYDQEEILWRGLEWPMHIDFRKGLDLG